MLIPIVEELNEQSEENDMSNMDSNFKMKPTK